MARVVEVKHPFGDLDLAAAGRFEAQELQREVQAQGEMLRQFVLAHVLVEVRLLHLSQRELQPFAREQPLMQVIPYFAGHEAARQMAAFVIERALSLPCGAECQLVHAAIQHGRILLQEQVERVVRELIVQEIQHFRRLFHLLLVVIEFAKCGISSPLGGKDLAPYLLDFNGEYLNLEVPFLFAPVPACLRQIQ